MHSERSTCTNLHSEPMWPLPERSKVLTQRPFWKNRRGLLWRGDVLAEVDVDLGLALVEPYLHTSTPDGMTASAMCTRATRVQPRQAQGLPRLRLERDLKLRPVVVGVVCKGGSVYHEAQNDFPAESTFSHMAMTCDGATKAKHVAKANYDLLSLPSAYLVLAKAVPVPQHPLDGSKELVHVAFAMLLVPKQADVGVEPLAVAQLRAKGAHVLGVLADGGVVTDADVHL
eukprot:CAMPEP_0119367558 /NCGR_PEP_ID=MMETSP1334-20130426/14333_1 /TAXON_ID=127549 /ORGANISM="Calcidiscus leptoporus, Strain RCC1130" /LENGTH=228 /DNA_ID=CAMNT_0007383995 /DNA_START=446 /DNA_END=1133 /DNA_ORIENTATION=+